MMGQAIIGSPRTVCAARTALGSRKEPWECELSLRDLRATREAPLRRSRRAAASCHPAGLCAVVVRYARCTLGKCPSRALETRLQFWWYERILMLKAQLARALQLPMDTRAEQGLKL